MNEKEKGLLHDISFQLTDIDTTYYVNSSLWYIYIHRYI